MTLEAVLKYPVVLLAGLIPALLFTRMWGLRAQRWGFVDVPGGRKIHRQPVPVGGGIAIFFAFHAVCAVVFLYPWAPFKGQVSIDWWLRFIPLSAAIVALGLIDDRFSLKPVMKLVGQVAVAVGAYLLDIRVQNILGATLPVYVDFLITVMWFLILINSFNLIDGIDGLAAGIAVIASLGLGMSLVFRSEPGDVLLLLGFAGACAGFLRYNFYPARIFLGDTGSHFIGFTLAALAISTSSKGPALAAIGMPLLAVGVPLFDTLLAVWRRSVRRMMNRGQGPDSAIRVDTADADHLHHRLLRGGRPQHHVAWILYAMTAVLAGVGILATTFHDRAMGILGLAFFLGAYTIIRHLAWIELRESGEAVLQGLAKPVRRNRTLLFYVLADILLLNAVLLIVNSLMTSMAGDTSMDMKRMWLRHAPLDVGLPFLCLILVRSYSRVWYLARISEYISTGVAAGFGFGLAGTLHLLGAGAGGAEASVVVRYLLLAGMSAPLLVALRASMRVVQDLMQWMYRGWGGRDIQHGPRALICGAGYQATLFLRQKSYRTHGHEPLHIVGLVHGDDATRGHFVHGYPVLGNYDDVEGLLKEHQIDVLYLVEWIPAEQEQRLRNLARQQAIRWIHWQVVETEEAVHSVNAALGPSHDGSESEPVAGPSTTISTPGEDKPTGNPHRPG